MENGWKTVAEGYNPAPMRRIALINQKGGVGKTTTVANLGAALALAGKRVVVVDLDPQANLTVYLGAELAAGEPSSYRVLTGEVSFAAALRDTSTPNLRLLPTDIHLSGAELELSGAVEREKLLRTALSEWVADHARRHAGAEPADYVLFDCPPSLGLLSLNALAASDDVFLVVQTHFLALQGMSKLVDVIELVKQRLHPGLELGGIVACMYDSRMRLAREVLSELRRYFPAQVFRTPISANVKLAESPSFGKTIFEYAPESIGARDFASLSHEVLAREAARPRLAVARDAEDAQPERAPAAPATPASPGEDASLTPHSPARARHRAAKGSTPAPGEVPAAPAVHPRAAPAREVPRPVAPGPHVVPPSPAPPLAANARRPRARPAGS